MDNLIAAYVEEYGRELADELLDGEVFEGEIIVDDQATESDADSSEGEIVTDEQEATTFGQAGEDDGVDSSEKE